LIRSEFGRWRGLAFPIAVYGDESSLLEAEWNGCAALIELDVRRDLRDRKRHMKQAPSVFWHRIERKAIEVINNHGQLWHHGILKLLAIVCRAGTAGLFTLILGRQ
jgi:hypothetical protein